MLGERRVAKIMARRAKYRRAMRDEPDPGE